MQSVYYSGWSVYSQVYLKDIDLRKTSNIIYAFIKPEADGTLAFHDENADLKNLDQLKTLKKSSENKHLRTLVSIGGWTFRDQFKQAVYTNADRFIISIAEFLNKYDLDGVDLDWEYPESAEDAEILRYLVYNLHKCGIVSLALRGYPTLTDYQLRGLEPYVDAFYIMTYDYNLNGTVVDVPVHLNDVERSLRAYLVSVPAHKLHLGVNTYKNTYRGRLGDKNMGSGIITNCGVCINGLGNEHRGGMHVHSNNGTTDIYECTHTIDEKRRLVTKYNLAGMFFWDFKGCPHLVNYT